VVSSPSLHISHNVFATPIPLLNKFTLKEILSRSTLHPKARALGIAPKFFEYTVVFS